MQTQISPRRQATPARWQAALKRALSEGVQVRQLAGSGAWVAMSGTDATVAYEVSGMTCECPAGAHGDPVCKHRAAYWHQLGALTLDPEPDPPASAVAAERARRIRRLTARLAADGVPATSAQIAAAVDHVIRLEASIVAEVGQPAPAPTRPCWQCVGTDPRCLVCGGEGELPDVEPAGTAAELRRHEAPYDFGALPLVA